MSSRILKSAYPVDYKPNLTAQPVDLRYDPENGNVELVQQGLGGQVLYKNGEFTDQGNNVLQENSKDALEESIINDVRAAAPVVNGELQPWVTASGEAQEALNFGIVDPNNELFSVTSQDFQEDNPIKPENLIYPISSNSSQNRINITQRRYVSAIDSLGENNNIFNPRFNQPATQEEFLGTVVLPMPNNISESNSTGWGENSLSTLAAQVMTGALGVVGNIGAGKILEGGQEAINEMKKLATDASSKKYIKQLLTLNAAASLTKFLGINIDPEAYRSRATGTVINPNLELLFNGPKLRSFGFEFKMIPRSKEEAKNIRYILKFFKKGMAAKRGTTGEGYFLGAPNVFDIEFKGSEKNIGKIKTCALQSFNVNYTPDGVYAAFNDSQPISVVMQLAFTELTPIYNDNYDENIDSVGWDNQN